MSAEVVSESIGVLKPLRIRAALGRDHWGPAIVWGHGWAYRRLDHAQSVIVTAATWSDGNEWIHASIAGTQTPTYEDLQLLFRAVWGVTGWAYQVFAPVEHHVNIHAHALHLWGRSDGQPALPNFGALGSI